jgi:hypothetical protein
VSGFKPVAGYFERQPDPEFGSVVPRCLDHNGKHFCTARQTLIASQGGMIMMMLDVGKGGLFFELTPAGVRRFCDDLLTVADKVEAEHANRSNELLAEVLKRPPPEQPAT